MKKINLNQKIELIENYLDKYLQLESILKNLESRKMIKSF